MITKNEHGYTLRTKYKQRFITVNVLTKDKVDFQHYIIDFTSETMNAKTKTSIKLLNPPFMEMIDLNNVKGTVAIIPINVTENILTIYSRIINYMIKELSIYYGL